LAAEGEQAFPGKGHLPAVEEELRRLRAENQKLRMEREILKKLALPQKPWVREWPLREQATSRGTPRT
jgi:transposase-like protein